MFNTKPKLVEQDFTAHLRGLIAKPPEGSLRWDVTPKMATEMLAYNHGNRSVRRSRVEDYALQMKQGRWIYTGEPIIFSDAGILRQGQHRLMACVTAETDFPVDVCFGKPDEGFAYMDIGAKRSGGDIFGINGVKNATRTAAVAKVLLRLLQGGRSVGAGLVSPAELFTFYESLEDLQPSVSWSGKFARAGLGMPAVAGACHYLFAQKNKEQAADFMTVVLDGGSAGAPSQELHRLLIKNATADTKMRGAQMAGLFITAWNRQRKGLSGRGLKFALNAKIPAVR